MNRLLNITSHLTLLLLLVLLNNDVHAQLQNYEFGLCRRGKKCVPENSGWRMRQNIIGITMRGHASVVDLFVNRNGDHRFRFGDYLGAGFSTGYVNEKINPDGNDLRELKSMWLSIDLGAGLQAAYAINDQLAVGAHAFFEYQFGYVIMTDYSENIYAYKVFGVNARYGRICLEYNQGLPWDVTDAEDYDDYSSRVQLRFFTNRGEGTNIGFRFEAAQRKWYGGKTDRLTTLGFCFGRMF